MKRSDKVVFFVGSVLTGAAAMMSAATAANETGTSRYGWGGLALVLAVVLIACVAAIVQSEIGGSGE